MERKKNKRQIRLTVSTLVLAVFCILMASFISLPNTVSAATTYWCSSTVPAKNSTYDLYYYHYHADLGTLEAAQVDDDGETEDLYSSGQFVHEIVTNDFSNESEMIDPDDTDYWAIVQYMPPPTATILSVYVRVEFNVNRPDTELAFSINNGTDWEESGLIYGSPYTACWSWNVTDLAEWTVSILNSTDLCARGQFYVDTYTHYYLDYIGFTVTWCGDFVGGGNGGEELEDDPGPSYDLNSLWAEGGLVGLMGFAGAIMCVFVPALAIYAMRHSGDDKIAVLVKMIALFIFSVTLLLFAIYEG